MRRIALLCTLPFLASCEGLALSPAVTAVLQDPQMVAEVASVAADALGGNYIGALWGAGSIAAAAMGWKGMGWLKKRATESEPGKVI